MTPETFWLDANDRSGLFVNQWLGDGTPRAVVLLAHGMAEHSGRYAYLGQTLCAAGFALYAHDQRGHGKTAERGTLGYFADNDGWSAVVSDVGSLAQHIGQTHPGVPIFLLGHSMGIYIAQAYLMHHNASLQGAILSASNFQPVALYRAASLIARSINWHRLPRRWARTSGASRCPSRVKKCRCAWSSAA